MGYNRCGIRDLIQKRPQLLFMCPFPGGVDWVGP